VTAPKDIKRLVERFQENRDVYCSGAYNETQAVGTGWFSRPQLEKLSVPSYESGTYIRLDDTGALEGYFEEQ